MKFSQMTQRVGNRFKQRLVPFVNGVYGKLRKLASGNPIVITDASDESLTGLRVFGKSTQDGTPTPDAPVEIVSVENPTVKVDSQTLFVPYTLRGIPVNSGGNYTDENGQQWICDEVDFARGVYVQRVQKLNLESYHTWRTWGVNAYGENTTGFYHYIEHTPLHIDAMSNIETFSPLLSGGNITGVRMSISGSPYVQFGVSNELLSDISTSENAINSFKELVSTAGAYVLFIIDPIETPLTAEQITAYKALHTNEPNTTILNDQNAWMEVSYIAK